MDDFYGNGAFLRRWLIDNTGQLVCPFNAVEVATTATADIEAIKAANAAARARIAAVEEYEAALRVRSGEQPPRDEDYIDENGQERTRWSAAYREWWEAGKTIEDATADTIALAEIRATGGVVTEAVLDPETGEPTGEVLIVSTPAPLVDDYVPGPAPVPSEAVNAERDRRIVAGFDFNGVRFQSRPEDRENIMGAFSMADTALTVGGKQPGDLRWHDGDEDFVFIAEDNTRVPMDAVTVLGLGKAAAAQKSAMTFAANDLKKMNPIPADFTDDRHWPA